MFFWLIVQSIVAFNAELFHDEAYYWLYSKYPDWGYFDHPPLVAMLIKIGNFITESKYKWASKRDIFDD